MTAKIRSIASPFDEIKKEYSLFQASLLQEALITVNC